MPPLYLAILGLYLQLMIALVMTAIALLNPLVLGRVLAAGSVGTGGVHV